MATVDARRQPFVVKEKMAKKHGGKRLGAGRKRNNYPKHSLVVIGTANEIRSIRQAFTTRERTEVLLTEIEKRQEGD